MRCQTGTFLARGTARVLCACGLFFALLGSDAGAQAKPNVGGVVDDATTGLGVANARVRALAADGTEIAKTVTDGRGRFTLRLPLAPNGVVRLRVDCDGYATTDSEPVHTEGNALELTLAIESAPRATTVRTIATTASHATTSLTRSTVIYRSLSAEALLASGVGRFGDALRTLPGVNNAINGDTAALGDDLQLNIRGFGNGNSRTGQIETTATLDGHPIGFGIPGGFNYQLSPTFGLKNITVYYGSAGTAITGYDAIGGIVDAQTIDPTPDRRIGLTQGAGTFGKIATNVTASGTEQRLGYAISYGVSNLDGPFNNGYFYQPGAAYDPSATAAAVRNLAVYRDDSAAVTRSGVFKLRYALSAATSLTLTSVNSSYWEDKTGNGDGDYLTPHIALLQGRGLLANKAAKDACPAGEFTATNANGTPWGTSPAGLPDGGNPCQTAQSYANDVAGLQGAGPAWQAFNFNDHAIHFRSGGERATFSLDAFTNRYLDTTDRTFRLPFHASAGDAGSFTNDEASAAGVVAREDLVDARQSNDFAFGLTYTNFAYKIASEGSLRGAPIAREIDAFVREAYRARSSPLSLSVAADFKHATTTNTSYADPRVSAAYAFPGGRDVLRVAAGATTAQPPANLLDQGFTPSPLLTAGGGGGVNCAATNSIGTAPSSLLRPERGVDEEFAYGHRFGADSQAELAVYNTGVFDKIYTTITPLSITGTGFIDPATLASIQDVVAAKCGGQPLGLLGVTGFVNIGQLRARGFTLSGRQRISPGTFFDYDLATTSTVVRSATPQFFAQNLTIVQNGQLPRLPLHTLTFALDGLVTPRLDVRYALQAVGNNNTKRIGAYNYSTLRVSATGIGHGTLSASVFNLFNQNAFIEGFLNEGEPLALNPYAKAAQYAPFVGAGATEALGLPYRSLYVSYTLLVGANR